MPYPTVCDADRGIWRSVEVSHHIAPTSQGKYIAVKGLRTMQLGRSNRGFILAEYVIAVGLLLIVATAVMQGLVFVASSNASTAMRAQALELANQCIEQARNLPYDSVGTVSGFPAGIIPDTQVVGNLTVNTDVEWAFDKSTSLETYKTITISVSWTTGRAGSVVLESSIAGKSLIQNTGDVKITVVDEDTAKPIQGATVQITAVTGTTSDKSTDASGSVTWGQVPAGNLTISGSAIGYALRLSQVASATVISGQMNQWTISAVKASTGIVSVKDQSGNAVSGAAVTISGPSGTLSSTTSASGTVTFTGLLKGTYTVTTSLSGYTNGSGTLSVIAGGSSYTASITISKKTTLKIVVKDDAGTLLSGVGLVVTPTDATGTPTTDASGMATFTVTGTGPYTVIASKTGYITGTATSGTLVSGTENTLNAVIVRIVPCTLNLTVVNQFSSFVSGATVSVSGPGSVTGPTVTDSSGKATFTLGAPGIYTINTSKTNYVTASATTGSIANGGTVAFTVTMSQITTGTLAVTYTSSASSSSPKYVYIYNASHAIAGTLGFTSKNQTISVALLAGQYYASTRSSWPGTTIAVTAPYLNVNTTVSLNVSSSN
jgi:hypothetical protein